MGIAGEFMKLSEVGDVERSRQGILFLLIPCSWGLAWSLYLDGDESNERKKLRSEGPGDASRSGAFRNYAGELLDLVRGSRGGGGRSK
jgi:hypothetical protein